MNFQIQRIQSGDAINRIETLLHALNAQTSAKRLKVSVDFEPADDFCNVAVDSEQPSQLWEGLTSFAAENAKEFAWIKRRWIVVLEGEKGWDDYLLLAHFDSLAKLDSIGSQ